ncbi:MAG: hypothetical protein ACREID_05125 [Planctomycetota bacterium]
MRRKATIRLVRVEIVSFDSVVADRHDIAKLPTLRLYDGTKLLSEDTDAILAALQR